MEKKQIKLLLNLAKKLNKEKRSKEDAFNSLKEAGLLTPTLKIMETNKIKNETIISSKEFEKEIEEALDDGVDVFYTPDGGEEFYNKTYALESIMRVIKKYFI